MTINLSSRLFFERATSTMQSLSSRLDTLNTQVSTGKKLIKPADDSAGWQRLQGIARANTTGAQDMANVKIAQSVLAQADTTLGAIGEQLQRAGELLTQGRTGTNSAAANDAIATELEGVLQTIVGLANAKDARGTALFGGADEGPAVYSQPDGSLKFATGTAAAIPIGDGQTVEATVHAASFMVTGSGDLGSAISAIVAALRSGEAVPEDAADTLATISDQVTTTQASIGARAARVEIHAAQLASAADTREIDRSGIEDADATETIIELQKTMTILQATQASFSKLSGLSLFNYLK